MAGAAARAVLFVLVVAVAPRASAEDYCSERLGIAVSYPAGTFDRVEESQLAPKTVNPLWVPWPPRTSFFTGHDCNFAACLEFDSFRPGTKQTGHWCVAASVTSNRGGLKFFSDLFEVRTEPDGFQSRLPRKIGSIREVGLLADGSLKTFKEAPAQVLDARHSNGNRLVVIEASVDVSELSRNREPSSQPSLAAEVTTLRYHPGREAWLRLSCFAMGTEDVTSTRTLALDLTRSTKLVSSCPR